MARKGILDMADDDDDVVSPAPSQKEIAPAIKRGPVGAMSNDLTLHSVREIEVERIIDDGMKDRFTTDDEDIAALRASIQEYGQQVPIMVRPISERPGFFRIVYGRRRLTAIRPLGIKIKALIRTLSDVDAILAQGQENNLRRDPSFMEKALFAQTLSEDGIEANVIYAALNIDRAIRSRMKAITDRVPQDVITVIGAAPGVGRRRWGELADAIERDPSGVDRGHAALCSLPDTATSDTRFDAFHNAANRSSANVVRGQHSSPEPTAVTTDGGRSLGTIQRRNKVLDIRIDTADNTEFGQWVEENGAEILRRIHAEWAATTGNSDEQQET